MMKFNSLVIDCLGELTDKTLKSCRLELGLTEDQFKELLIDENGEIFNILDNSITDLLLSQADKNYMATWLNTVRENQKTIVNKYSEFFRNFFLFVHITNKMFNQIEKQTTGSVIQLKEVTLFCLFGNLCRMADEIGILLTNGATKAALILWRIFYEYVVIGIFLMRHDSDELYQKYAAHGHKNVDKQKNSFVKHFEELKFPPLASSKIQEIELRTAEIKKNHGNDFSNDYAWAKSVFGSDKKKLTFFEIELDANMSRYRPFYIWASGIVHPTYNSVTNYFNVEGKLVMGDITKQELDFQSYIDPAQLTLVTFYSFLNYFLHSYSANEEYTTSILLLKKIIERLKNTFPSESD